MGYMKTCSNHIKVEFYNVKKNHNAGHRSVGDKTLGR